MMRKKILVLGASGYIGSRVTASLAATDWAIAVAANRGGTVPKAANVEPVALDATNESAVAAALRGCEGAVNCVSGNSDTLVSSARALFAAAGPLNSLRVVHLSSMSVYGGAVGLVNEDAPLRGDTGAYAAAKVEAEKMALGYARAVTLRPGCVYGPGSPQWSGRVADWLVSRRVGDMGAAGDGICNLSYIDDVVEAIIKGLQEVSLAGQIFNVATADPPSWNEYFVAYARALGAVPVRRFGRRRLKVETRLLAPPLKILEIVASKTKLRALKVPPPIPPSLARTWAQDIRLDVHKAERQMGISWTPLQKGLAAAAAWYLATVR